MQKILLIIFFLSALAPSIVPAQRPGPAFYVSPAGDDSWSGQISEPDPTLADGPFRTLVRARSAVRSFKASHPNANGITVWIRAGTYRLSDSFRLDRDDSGREGAPVRWRASPGEAVRIVGGRAISGCLPLTDPEVVRRLRPAARAKVVQIDLAANSITDAGKLKMVGMGLPVQPAPLELFFKGKAMTPARYPDRGWLQIADVPQNGDTLIHAGVTHTPKDGVPRGRHFGRFAYDGNRPSSWATSENVWMHGYWSWDWADARIPIASIDTTTRTIFPAEPHYHYGYTREQRFYFFNVLEELDAPGEYYVDSAAGILYFWPPSPVGSSDVFVSELEKTLWVLDGASHVSIEGLTFEGTRGHGIEILGGSNNRIAGCTIRNVGNVGVIVSGGTDHSVISCDLSDTGDGGIRLDGGDRRTLSPGRHVAENNHITRFSRVNLTYRHGIQVRGVGNLVRNNRIHDAPHEAIYFGGNEHVIEFNEIYNIVQETGDAGAIHTGRDYTWRGNVIRYNYFHDLHGPGLFGVMGVYLDDFMSATTVYGNIFYRAGRAVFLGGGRDNVVENNIFVDCEASVHIDARGTTWASYYFDGTFTRLTDRMTELRSDRPPYSERYPELLTLYQDDPAIPKNNRVLRNVSFKSTWLDIEDGVDVGLLRMEGNVIADSILCYWRGPEVKDAPTGLRYTRADSAFVRKLAGNLIMTGDPGFVDAADGDFRLLPGSPALQTGFQPIPVEKIGLYLDEFRELLPER